MIWVSVSVAVGDETVNRTCSSALGLHCKVVDLDVTSNFVVEVDG